MNKEQLIKQLKNSEKETLQMIYVDNREAFINFARKFYFSENDIVDVYQDAIIVLQEKAIKGDLDDLKCAIKTYLFGIGKYMLFDKARKNNRKVADFPLENEDYNYQEISTAFINDSINDKQLLLQKVFVTLGKKCKEVLTLFYYRGFTIDEIATHLNYENKNVVKSQKSRCIKQLKEKINN